MSCKILSNDKITDREFLELMIKHHNVAIKMSQLVMMTSVDDFIIDFARKTVLNQSNEVTLMDKLLKNIPNMQNEKSCNCGNSVISAQLEKVYPNIFSNLKCQEHHFENFTDTSIQLKEAPKFETVGSLENPAKQLNLDAINSQKISDKEFIEHMMEHHKSGLDLARLAIKSTKEPKILMLAQTMVLEQEKDIFMLKNLVGCLNNNWREKLNQK